MMVSASIVIVGVGIGVVFYCTVGMMGVTRVEEAAVETGVLVRFSGLGGRFVDYGITITGT
ncbi:hypothetical protein Tco_0617000, partial [Tanacetum coccineum]